MQNKEPNQIDSEATLGQKDLHMLFSNFTQKRSYIQNVDASHHAHVRRIRLTAVSTLMAVANPSELALPILPDTRLAVCVHSCLIFTSL